MEEITCHYTLKQQQKPNENLVSCDQKDHLHAGWYVHGQFFTREAPSFSVEKRAQLLPVKAVISPDGK